MARRKAVTTKPKQIPIYELFKTIITLFPTEGPSGERPMFKPLDMRRGEGPGERLYRWMHGLNMNIAGFLKGRDFPEHDHKEMKSVFCLRRKKATKSRSFDIMVPDLSNFKAGQCACDALAGARWDVASAHAYNTGWNDRENKLRHDISMLLISFKPNVNEEAYGCMTGDDLKSIVMSGLSARQMARLPVWAREMIHDAIRPSIGLAECKGGIACSIPEGYLDVPFCDFDEAFRITGVSKGAVHYGLRREYVQRRYDELLALARSVQPVPDSVPVDALGQVPDECHAVPVG